MKAHSYCCLTSDNLELAIGTGRELNTFMPLPCNKDSGLFPSPLQTRTGSEASTQGNFCALCLFPNGFFFPLVLHSDLNLAFKDADVIAVAMANFFLLCMHS